jgi:hypothetical protein
MKICPPLEKQWSLSAAVTAALLGDAALAAQAATRGDGPVWQQQQQQLKACTAT